MKLAHVTGRWTAVRTLGVPVLLFACIQSGLAADSPPAVQLWLDGAPGAKGDADEDKPFLYIHAVETQKSAGAAVIICPGGGYRALIAERTPPTFLLQTDADTVVPSEHSVLFYLALREAKVRAEMHVYGPGPHGVGLNRHPMTSTWPNLARNWMQGMGWLEPLKD